MKILLTGGKGFTGRHFTAVAKNKGHQVTLLKTDLEKPDELVAEIRLAQPEHVLHLAAISFVGHADARALYDVNLFGTINLLNALAELAIPPRAVILASSANVYGNCPASPICESQVPEPSNHYGISKLAMEHAAHLYDERLPIVIARPFNYTGPGQGLRFVIPKLINHFSHGEASIHLGETGVEREFNDVLFVCDAYLHLLAHGEKGQTYNVCSGSPYTLDHVIRTLSQITGHHIAVETDPAFVRFNEVHSLCGNPARLNALITTHGLKLTKPSLSQTLRRMLESYSHCAI